MNGDISFQDSLARRIALLPLRKSQLPQVIDIVNRSIALTFRSNIEQLLASYNIYIVSGGFKEIIDPVMKNLNFPINRVFANTLVFENGEVSGVDQSNPLANKMGKPKVAKQLKLTGHTVVVGDGYTDYQIKEQHLANEFYYYREFINRPSISSLADRVIDNFSQLT